MDLQNSIWHLLKSQALKLFRMGFENTEIVKLDQSEELSDQIHGVNLSKLWAIQSA